MSTEVIVAVIVALPALITSIVLLAKLLGVARSTHQIVNQQRTDMLAELSTMRKEIARLKRRLLLPQNPASPTPSSRKR